MKQELKDYKTNFSNNISFKLIQSKKYIEIPWEKTFFSVQAQDYLKIITF